MEHIIFASILGLLTLLILIKELINQKIWTIKQARTHARYSKHKLRRLIKEILLSYKRKYSTSGLHALNIKQIINVALRPIKRSYDRRAANIFNQLIRRGFQKIKDSMAFLRKQQYTTQQGRKRTSDERSNAMPSSVAHALSLLDLGTDATGEQVRHRYHLLAKRYHPDAGGDQEQFIHLQAAYNCVITWMQTRH